MWGIRIRHPGWLVGMLRITTSFTEAEQGAILGMGRMGAV